MTAPPALLTASAILSLPLSPSMGSGPILAPSKPWQCPSIPSSYAPDAPSNLISSSLRLSLCFQALSSRSGPCCRPGPPRLPGNNLGCNLEAGIPGCHRNAFPFPTSGATRGLHTSQTIQLSHLVPLSTVGSRKYLVNHGGLEPPYYYILSCSGACGGNCVLLKTIPVLCCEPFNCNKA